MLEIPIEIWAIILLAVLGYALVMAKIWRSSNREPKVTYAVIVSKKEAEKILKKTTTKKKPKLPKASTPCKKGQHFGFLHELPKNTPIPDNCLDCPRMLDCMKKKARK